MEFREVSEAEDRKIFGQRRIVRADRRAQLGRTGARIALCLGLGGRDRAARACRSSRPSHAFRADGANRRIARAVREEALDDAVFERMERHDDKPSAGLQDTLGRMQRAHQFAKLVIDENAQCLEHPCRRMDLVLRISADKRFDRIGKVQRAGEWPVSRRFSIIRAMRPAWRSSPRKLKMRARSPDLEAIDHIGGTCARPAPCACRAAHPYGRKSRARPRRSASRTRRCRARCRRPASA